MTRPDRPKEIPTPVDWRAIAKQLYEAILQYEWSGQGGIQICEVDEDWCQACLALKSRRHKKDCLWKEAIAAFDAAAKREGEA